MANDPIKRLRAGEPVKESWLGHLVDAVNLHAAGGNVFVDSTGVYHRPDPRTGAVLRRFELTENLTFGSNATALVLKWTGAAFATVADSEFEVYDPFSEFNQNDKPTGQDGARGYAHKIDGRWEITKLQHQARWIHFVVNDGDDFTTADSSVVVDGVTYHDGYQPNTAITTVYNPSASANYVFSGSDDDEGWAQYDPAGNKYWIDNKEC